MDPAGDMPEAREGPSAFELAVSAISRKERTVAELRDWLLEREIPPEEIEEALGRLIEIGELDDERFARLFAEDKRELRGWGPERIRETLVARGIPRAAAEAVAREDHSDQAERAAALIADRGDDLTDDRGRSRALSFLARRGYDLEVAYQAVRLARKAAAG